MDKDMMVENAGKYVVISWKGNSMESDPIDLQPCVNRSLPTQGGGMEIGIQCDTRVYLDTGRCKIAHWTNWIHSLANIIAITLSLLMIMLTPAHAAVEVKQPVGGGYYMLQPNGPGFGQYSTVAVACNDWLVNYCTAYFVTIGGRYCYDLKIDVREPDSGFDGGFCDARVYMSEYSTSIGVRFVEAVCPIPTIDPQNKFVYNRSKGMCVRTVPDKLSIELEKISTVEPSKTRSIKATVKGPDGPQGGVAVTVILDVKATSGGHDHGESFDVRPRGGLSGATACPSTAPPRSVCATGATSNTAPNVGVAMFTFTAPAPAGTHTFTATCKECTNTATASVDVKVEGLVQIPDSIFYTLIEADGKTVIGATTNHGKNHYLTHGAAQKLQLMAIFYRYNPEFWLLKDAYKGQNLNGKKNLNTHMYPQPLHLNDASLVWGGVFDISGKWGPAHAEHRRGTVIDVRANANPGAISASEFKKFSEMALKYTNSDAQIHCRKGDGQKRQLPSCVGSDGSQDVTRHFHIRLLGDKE